MKKYIVLLLSILLVFSVGCSNDEVNEVNNTNETNVADNDNAVVEDEAVVDNRSIEEISKTFNTDLADMNIENLLNNYNYSVEMKEFMTEKVLNDTFRQMNLGKIVEQKEMIQENSNEFIIISTPTIFENNQLTVNVVFNQSKEIAGFNYGLFETDEPAVSELSIEELTLLHLQAFNDEDYAALMDFVYSEDMLAIVSEAVYKETKEGMNTGKALEVKQPFSYEVQGYVIVSVPVIYENIKYNYNLVFDNKKVIAGSNIGDYEERITVKKPDSIEEVTLVSNVNDMALDGILTTPKEGTDFPCVILVHGSGASDKDETVMNNKPFRDIAWGLAKRGIASYRYDKSNYSYPEKFIDNPDVTLYEETINDAVEIFKLIDDLENIDSVYILGHSLGGYSIPLIAEQIDADGYIIMAGNTRPLEVLIDEQINYLANLDGVVSEDEKSFIDTMTESINKIKDLESINDTERVLGATKAYWSFLSTYDPIEHAEKMQSDVLVLQGERDYQVTFSDYQRWLDAFGKNDQWTFRVYEKLNHLMIPGEGEPSNADYSTTGFVDEQVIEDISEWINDKK
ncbi:MAG: DUF3887 domain-containing protein [Clostridiales bacterium]|nr:DUF3887 domain-containing protein [Clostridiales bacterium]